MGPDLRELERLCGSTVERVDDVPEGLARVEPQRQQLVELVGDHLL
jgi:hypothetical protein